MMSTNAPARTKLSWRRSSFCEGGACVRVAADQGTIVVGDAKNPCGPILVYTEPGWRKFVQRVKSGAYDDFS